MGRNSGWWALGGLGLLLSMSPVLFVLLQWLEPQTEILQHFADYRLRLTLTNTLSLMSLTALWSLIFGVGSAFLLNYYPPVFPGVFRLLLLLPLSLPAYVSAFVYLGLADGWTRGGVVRWVQGGLGESALLVGSSLVLALCFYPYVFMMTYQALRKGNSQLEEVGQSLGRSFGAFVFRVLAPRSLPWVFGGVLLVVMEVLADFGAVSVLGFDTLSTEVYKAWHGFFSYAGAAQIASLPLVIVVVLLLVDQYLQEKRRQQEQLLGYETAVNPKSVSLLSKTLSSILLATLGVFSLLLPLAQLSHWALTGPGQLGDSDLWTGFLQSLLIGVGAGLSMLVLVLSFTLAQRYTRSVLLRFMDKVASLSYALPGPVLALGLLGVTYFLKIPVGGYLLLVVGLSLRFFIVGGQPLRGEFMRLPVTFDEVSDSLGRGRVDVLKRVYWPVLRGGALVGFLVAAIESFKEMPLTLMLRPLGWEPLSVQVFSLTTEGEYQRASLPALLLVLLSVLSLVMVWRGQDQARGQ